jgi:hypothetical protein
MQKCFLFPVLFLGLTAQLVLAVDQSVPIPLRVSWGHRQAEKKSFYLKIVAPEVRILKIAPRDFEEGDALRSGPWLAICKTRAGGGDADGVELLLDPYLIWGDYLAMSDPDTVRRLKNNPGYSLSGRWLTFQLNPEGTQGFSVTLDQLLQARSIWIPALDVYLDAGTPPQSFDEHLAALKSLADLGGRVLDQVARDPEATYEQYKNLWADMGSPDYQYPHSPRHDRLPHQPPSGHVVCLTWDSAIPKFGIDRGAGVWSDFGNPDCFRVWFDFGELSDLPRSWKAQRLIDGFPVIATILEGNGVRCEIEQFAYPLHGPPAERRGDIAMTLMQKVRLTELSDLPHKFTFQVHHLRRQPAGTKCLVVRADQKWVLENAASHETLLSFEGLADAPMIVETKDQSDSLTQTTLRCGADLPRKGVHEFVIKLPSPAAGEKDRAALLSLDYAAARAATLKFWADYEARGARFQVPEAAVNELFRVGLWHALRLPRRHGGQNPNVKIDLPYSPFAYKQDGTPWPVNQAAYADYMIYGLRGYYDIAAEEIQAIYRNNQKPDGCVGSIFNWLVDTPAMLYAVGQNYLLSRDQAAFDRLLPESLKAMDWCLQELEKAKKQPGNAQGIVRGRLNDGTGTGLWTFNQAYLYAGLDRFGRALQARQHPRAAECLAAAREFQTTLEHALRVASVQAAIVQLRDHTWIPYVPCALDLRGRLFAQWYPTEIDTGSVHLLRLKALSARSDLADFLLNDHEDNLFLNGWGMANEPAYNQQGYAYLFADNPKAAIRTFYSMMACAFSHTVYEAVEHRWGANQYFCPPSTDAAWFELYRNMLIREADDGALLLLQATPRVWLADGKKISIQRAPTCFGPVDLNVESHAAQGFIAAEVHLSPERPPTALQIRFRHPEGKPLRSVTVNDQAWSNFDPKMESVKIERPAAPHYRIRAEY